MFFAPIEKYRHLFRNISTTFTFSKQSSLINFDDYISIPFFEGSFKYANGNFVLMNI
jgi:hypothetical protein